MFFSFLTVYFGAKDGTAEKREKEVDDEWGDYKGMYHSSAQESLWSEIKEEGPESH